MRVTVDWLGLTLDVSLGPSTTADETCSLDGGTTASYPVGFARHDAPPEVTFPERTPAWDEPEEATPHR